MLQRADGGSDTTVPRRVREVIRWEVVKNDDGRHLCISRGAATDRRCEPLRVIPETELHLGSARFIQVLARQ